VTFGGWQSQVQTDFAVDIYRTFWDCEVIENDSYGTNGERVAQLLDFGDVDKIIRIGTEQVFMAQRFRKPYWNGEEWAEPDMTLRYSRPYSDNIVEYERLMENVGSDRTMYPSRYALGRVYNNHEDGIYELYILDTEKFVNAIREREITEYGPIKTEEGQEFMSYDINEIERVGAIVKKWPNRPENPGDITSWADD
jgi:hypothetical protein